MGLNNGVADLPKLDAFRAALDESAATSADANPTTYCTELYNVSTSRLSKDTFFSSLASPDPTYANNLFTFIAGRLNIAFSTEGLNCAVSNY